MTEAAIRGVCFTGGGRACLPKNASILDAKQGKGPDSPLWAAGGTHAVSTLVLSLQDSSETSDLQRIIVLCGCCFFTNHQAYNNLLQQQSETNRWWNEIIL